MSSALRAPAPLRQVALLTAGAALLLVLLHYVPAGPRLSHMDFIPGGTDAVQFCDPSNPQFLPVVRKASPVSVEVASEGTDSEGRVEALLSLKTISGKPIGPDDLSATANEKMLILAVDPSLGDFQALRAAAGPKPGLWTFAFHPTRTGPYRVFADFTPAALEKEVYASAELTVPSPMQQASSVKAGPGPVEEAGYRFTLTTSESPLYTRQSAVFHLSVAADAGGMVPLIPEFGAYARLTGFDQDRTGMVNLHRPTSVTVPDSFKPSFPFRLSFQDPGHYVVWAQVSLNGRPLYAPFGFDVLP